MATPTGVHPAIIAALASRESRVGAAWLLDERGFSKAEGNDGYGVMQVTCYCLHCLSICIIHIT